MISIKGLNKFFNKGRQNEIHVINDVTLDLPERGIIAIFGKSGCGKTTLLNVIGGLDGFSSGSVTVEGRSIAKNTDEIRNKYIGYVFQNYNLNVNDSCFDNVAAALRLCGMRDEEEIKRRVEIALKNVGMERYARRTPDTLSGGQQQRIAIARAIVKNPPVILADEPTGNLDEANTVMIMDLLREIARDHLVLLVTHEQSLVDAYCDRIIEISDGRIISSREGRAEGISRRSKQDIYLGELDRRDINSDGINIEYYGDTPDAPIDVKIVNKDGQLYLKLCDGRVKIVDDSGEIRLIDGVYEEDTTKEKRSFDMIVLPSVDGERYGKLFTPLSSLIEAYKRQRELSKRGKKALRTVMLLFSAVTVFMSAIFGASLGILIDADNSYNHNTFYLYTEEGDTSVIESALNDPSSAIDYYGLYPYHPSGDHQLIFRIAAFETFSQQGYSTTLQSHGVVLDETLTDGIPLVAGQKEYPSPEYMLISDRVADDLIDGAGLGFVDDYSDLIGMTCTSFTVLGRPLRVGGVVRSGEHAVYLSEMAVALYTIEYSGMVQVKPATEFGIQLNDGEAVAVISGEGAASVGQSVLLQGVSLNLTDVINHYGGYHDWLKYNGAKLTREEYFASILPDGEDLATYTDEHYFEYDEYYYDSIDSFLREQYIADTYSFELWLYVIKDISEVRNIFISTELNKAESYRTLYGRYPTKTEYDAIEDSLTSYDLLSLGKYNELYGSEFESSYRPTVYGSTCLVSNGDYIKISKSLGQTDPLFSNGRGYFVYTQIHSSDPAVTEAFLAERFGNREIEYYDSVITPDDILSTVISYESSTVIGYLVAFAVTLAVMSICMYFIMRSSLMSRIKEIGIYRAIGVSKGNIILRFGMEALLLASTTVVFGYLLSSAFIGLLSRISPNASEIFFYPVWYALLILAVLCGLTVVCGILPVLNLLRKTPSEILAKYDV